MALRDEANTREEDRRSRLDRFLRPFGDVRAREGVSALALAGTLFLLLTAYYLLKVIREPLILLWGGAEVKSYAAAGQALLLLPVLRAHGALAARVGRVPLIVTVLLFVTSNLLVFAALLRAHVAVGLAFYLWVGTFNYLLVATFWSFANDVYTPEQGKRLFAIVGVGSSLGALSGAAFAGWLLKHLAPPHLMLVAAAMLTAAVVPFLWVDRWQHRQTANSGVARIGSEPLTGAGGFKALVEDRYLLLIAVLTLLTNWVTNSGEYLLDKTLIEVARSGAEHIADPQRFVGQFKATYFWWVNLLGVVGQLFVVSRALKHLGIGGSLLALPLVAMLGASSMLLFPTLWVIRTAKTAEKSVDYSLETTAVNALYLGVSRDAKYKAKAVIDTFVVRAGDICAAASVWIGVHQGIRRTGFAASNVLLTAIWFGVALRIRAMHRARTDRAGAAMNPGAVPAATA